MNLISAILFRKIATVTLITVSIAAFATLGDGGKKSVSSNKSLLTNKAPYNFKSFSLKTGYQYRGASILSLPQANQFITLNTVVTYHKGNTTYILPLKKKLVLDKIKFNPGPSR